MWTRGEGDEREGLRRRGFDDDDDDDDDGDDDGESWGEDFVESPAGIVLLIPRHRQPRRKRTSMLTDVGDKRAALEVEVSPRYLRNAVHKKFDSVLASMSDLTLSDP